MRDLKAWLPQTGGCNAEVQCNSTTCQGRQATLIRSHSNPSTTHLQVYIIYITNCLSRFLRERLHSTYYSGTQKEHWRYPQQLLLSLHRHTTRLHIYIRTYVHTYVRKPLWLVCSLTTSVCLLADVVQSVLWEGAGQVCLGVDGGNFCQCDGEGLC